MTPSSAEERAQAESVYAQHAFNFPEAPIGSRDWCLFWDGWQARASLGAAQVPAPSLTPEQVTELWRVTASFASPWPDIEGEHVIVSRVKMAARYLQQHRALLHKVEALRAMIRTAVGAGIPNFREKFDAELLALFDVTSFAELYDAAALSQPSQQGQGS